MARPTKRTVLASLGKKRMIMLDREFELGTSQAEAKSAFIEALASSKRASFQNVIDELPVAELKRICRAHELAVSGTKAELGARIRGVDDDDGETPQSAEEEQLGLEFDAFLQRSQPTVSAIVPMLGPQALKDLLRRLQEGARVATDLASVSPGIQSLATALEDACSLPVFLGELDRAQLASICRHYALEPGCSFRVDPRTPAQFSRECAQVCGRRSQVAKSL